MANLSYKDKLLDPRWQRKKNDILQRDAYTCQNKKCNCTTRTLHVHHLDYIGSIEPWDYPNDMLITLCSDCHAKEDGRPELEKNLANTLRLKGFLFSDLLAFSSKIDTDILFTKTLLKVLREFQNG